jgi:hypothetical protein
MGTSTSPLLVPIAFNRPYRKYSKKNTNPFPHFAAAAIPPTLHPFHTPELCQGPQHICRLSRGSPRKAFQCKTHLQLNVTHT